MYVCRNAEHSLTLTLSARGSENYMQYGAKKVDTMFVFLQINIFRQCPEIQLTYKTGNVYKTTTTYIYRNCP